MVLCAGYGTRLGDLTREIPKPMLRLGQAADAGVHPLPSPAARLRPDRAEPALHARSDSRLFRRRLAVGPANRILSRAATTGHRRRDEENGTFPTPSGSRSPFLVHYGDVITNHDFTAMLEFHRQKETMATLLVHKRRGPTALSASTPPAASSVSWSGRRRPSAAPSLRVGSFRALRSASRNCSIWCRQLRRAISPATCSYRWPEPDGYSHVR